MVDETVDKALALTAQASQPAAAATNVARSTAPRFSIMPSQIPTGSVGKAKFTELPPGQVSVRTLSDAFDRAIAHHLSLPYDKRVDNSKRAEAALIPYIGQRQDGSAIPLLGKNAKLLKTEEGKGEEPITLPDGRGVETTGLALAPAYEEGKFTTCPNSASCKAECLGKTSGNYFKVGGGMDLSEFKGPRLNSLKKTIAFMRNPEAFAVKLYDEIEAAKRMAAINGNHLGVRLNVLSDINPRVHKAIINGHPDVSFYDYTKNNTNPIASNHHYTYSSTGVSQPDAPGGHVENENQNWKQMRRRLDRGDNVAMAFSDKEALPDTVHDEETGKRYTVVNGDTHDFRPLDIQPEGADGVIIGLKNKKGFGTIEGAPRESKGFFVHYNPKWQVDEKGKFMRGPSEGISETTGKPKLGPRIPSNRMVVIRRQGQGQTTLTNDKEMGDQ